MADNEEMDDALFTCRIARKEDLLKITCVQKLTASDRSFPFFLKRIFRSET